MTTNGDVIDAFGDYSDSASFLSYRAFLQGMEAAKLHYEAWGTFPEWDEPTEFWSNWLNKEGIYHCPIKKSDANIVEAELIAEPMLVLKGVTTNDNL